MIRILLADDHDIVRAGMRLTLQDAQDIEIIGEARTGEEAILLAQQLKPDLVLLDMNMPGTDGFSTALRLLNHNPPTKVLIISSQESNLLHGRLLQIGVSGYLSKNTAPDIVKKTIRAIYSGEQFFDSLTSNHHHLNQPPFDALSDRELQIALMIARGMESCEIATRLFLSKKTVHGYHRELLKKLGLKKDVELTRLVIRHGLIDLDSV